MRQPLALLALLALLSGAAATAQTRSDRPRPTPRHFEVKPASGPIRVDGVLDEPAWADALTYDLPYEWSPGENTQAPVKTEFLLAYDRDYLYAAWRCHDPAPSAIRAHYLERDDIDTMVQDDHVELQIDSFGDHQRSYQFRVNPLGVQADALFNENAETEDFTFDMIWAAAGRITADGYVVEIAIPLDQLQFPRTPGAQTWGIDVERSYPRSVRHRLSSAPRNRDVVCMLCQLDRVTGFADLRPSHNLEFAPTLTAHRTDEADSAGGALHTSEQKVSPGVSAHWGVTPNIRLSAAVRPDFSQVEANAAQLRVNQRFALFFPEKRPFFLEGSDFFDTPLQTVFTRTVANPKWGLKVTGKEGPDTFGLFVAQDTDRGDAITIPSNQASSTAIVEHSVLGEVLRYQREVVQGSTLGVLFTGRQADDYHNSVYGADGFLRFNDSDTFVFQLLRSGTRYPRSLAAQFDQPLDAFGGNGLFANYSHTARDWNWTISYQDLARGFRTDSGYIPRVDIKDAEVTLERRFFGQPGDRLTQIYLGFQGAHIEDHRGQLTDQKLQLYGLASGPLQSSLQITLERDKTFFGGVLYDDRDHIRSTLLLQPNGKLLLSLATDVGGTVDFANNRPARIVEVSPGAQIKLGRHFNARLDHTLRRLDVQGGRLFTANLSQLRLVANFNTRTFVRTVFQYLDLRQSPELFLSPVPARERNLFTQLLFSYRINPQTAFFLGYSETRQTDPLNGLGPLDRTFFSKVGYALSF